ncbi:hypothetical protein EON66_02705 [archaeon]|nr:MAG: hypothetical protein EON66_02705 [archaeon]
MRFDVARARGLTSLHRGAPTCSAMASSSSNSSSRDARPHVRMAAPSSAGVVASNTQLPPSILVHPPHAPHAPNGNSNGNSSHDTHISAQQEQQQPSGSAPGSKKRDTKPPRHSRGFLFTRRLVAEFVGTFSLVFIHASLAGAVGRDARRGYVENERLSLDGNGLGVALSLIALVFALGPISGAHFNPAVTLAFFLFGAVPWYDVLTYVVVQVAAAFTAAAVLDGVVDDERLGCNAPRGISIGQAFGLELILTCMFLVFVLGTASRGKIVGPTAPLAVGAAIGTITLVGSSYGGGSVNPARSLAPGILTHDDEARRRVWIYIVAPLVGAAITAPFMRFLVDQDAEDKREMEAAVRGDAACAQDPVT